MIVDQHMMTGHAGHLRRRRHGAERADRDDRDRPRQKGRPQYRRMAHVHGLTKSSQVIRSLRSTSFTSGIEQRPMPTKQPHIEPEMAVAGFDEIVAGLSDEEARYEAQRCYSCGNCFECDGCFGACPGARDHQSSVPVCVISSITTCAPAAASVTSSVRVTRSI